MKNSIIFLLMNILICSPLFLYGETNSKMTGEVPLILFVAQPRIDFDQSNQYKKSLTNTIRSELNKSSKYKLANLEQDQDVERAKNFYEQCKSMEECARKDAEAEGAEIVLITEVTKIDEQCRITMRLENIFRKEIIKNKNSRSHCSFSDLESKTIDLIYSIMKDETINGTGTRSARITTNPPGAKLTINGQVMEPRTPWQGKIPTGNVDILLEIEGKNRFAPIHLIEPIDESSTVFIRNYPFAERNAFLLFDVSPAIADISVNSKRVNVLDNNRIPVEVWKDNEIVISAQKYQTEKINTPALEPDQEYPIKVNLVPNPCTLNVTSNPSEAEVYLDDKKIGFTPYSTKLPTGDHKVEVRRQFYDAQDISFYCNPEQIIQKAIVMKRAKYSPEDQERIDSSEKWRMYSYYGFGLGAIFGGLSYSKFNDFQKFDEQYKNATDPFEIESLRKKRELAKTQTISFAGGTLVTFGLSYLFFRMGDFPEDLKQKNTTITLLPTTKGTQLIWAFSW